MSRRKGSPSERGIALVTAMLLTLVVVVMGAGLIVSSRGAQRVETGFKNQQRTFEVAVAGLERAREVLRQCRYSALVNNVAATDPCFSLTNRLDAAAGADNQLVDVSSITAFEAGGGLSADDVPILTSSAGGVSYAVFLTNDPWDNQLNALADGSHPKGRNVVTLTAFARGANDEGFTVAQGIYRTGVPFPSPTFPGLVTLPGPSVDYDAPTSGSLVIDGDFGDPPCYAVIATATSAARDDVMEQIPNNKEDQYHTCNPGGGGTRDAGDLPGSVENFIDTTALANPYPTAAGEPTNDPQLADPGDSGLGGVISGCVGNTRDLVSVSCMTGLRQAFQGLAQELQSVGRGYYGTSPTSFGTLANPKVVVDTNDLTLNHSDCPGTGCAGTLVVFGDLTLDGNVSYTGQIFAIGNGAVTRNGGGGIGMCGGILVADVVATTETADNFITANNLVGEPFYDHNGGGNSTQRMCEQADQGGITDWSLPMARIAFQQLR